MSNILFRVRISKSVKPTNENDALICLTIAMTALSPEGRKGKSVRLFASPSLWHNGLLVHEVCRRLFLEGSPPILPYLVSYRCGNNLFISGDC